ncbi:MAG TPA: sugar transferase [Mycobacterium sp.]|nr:sugar transferase [Mycobacterium sp.]
MTSIRVTDVLKPWRQPLEAPAFDLPGSEALRRALNVTVAAAGLVAVTPLMVVIALAIKLTSRGPVFYTQMRVGMDRRAPGAPAGNSRRRHDSGGRPFRIYKFRTMSTAQQSATAEVWAQQNDPRITAIGRILRGYRLDELPQLINVLLGDMNVVGPRPEQPTIFVRLRDEIERYQERQRVRPGITGWAQINQQYDSSVDDVRRKLQLDLEYISRVSATEDLRIMLRTFPVMVGKQGSR